MSQTNRKPYPSDLTDEQWELIEEMIPAARFGGRPRAVNMREVVNGILYLARSGCQWDMLPHDFPRKSTVYDYFAAWRDDGTWQLISDMLVGTLRQTEARSGEIYPSAASIDSQTVKTSERSAERGYDGGKKITGRKRHIAVDTLGLLLATTTTRRSTRHQDEEERQEHPLHRHRGNLGLTVPGDTDIVTATAHRPLQSDVMPKPVCCIVCHVRRAGVIAWSKQLFPIIAEQTRAVGVEPSTN